MKPALESNQDWLPCPWCEHRLHPPTGVSEHGMPIYTETKPIACPRCSATSAVLVDHWEDDPSAYVRLYDEDQASTETEPGTLDLAPWPPGYSLTECHDGMFGWETADGAKTQPDWYSPESARREAWAHHKASTETERERKPPVGEECEHGVWRESDESRGCRYCEGEEA